jgi:hypothetical protein
VKLQLLGHVAPFLRVVGEDTGEDADDDRHTLTHELDTRLAILLEHFASSTYPTGPES